MKRREEGRKEGRKEGWKGSSADFINEKMSYYQVRFLYIYYSTICDMCV